MKTPHHLTVPQRILAALGVAASPEHLRRDFILISVEIGTPWDDKDAHIAVKTMIARETFILEGAGSLTRELAEIGRQAEAFIREQLIPAAIKREEERRRDAAHQNDEGVAHFHI
jgi:hypothetical protein